MYVVARAVRPVVLVREDAPGVAPQAVEEATEIAREGREAVLRPWAEGFPGVRVDAGVRASSECGTNPEPGP